MLSPVVLLLALLSLLVVGFEILVKVFIFPEARIKTVLDIIVNAAGHELLDLDPLVPELLVQLHQLQILSNRPLVLVQVRVDVVVPSLAALLPDAPWQESGNLLPFLQPQLCHLFPEYHVFFRCPIALDLLHSAVACVVSEVEPSIHAFNLALVLAQHRML